MSRSPEVCRSLPYFGGRDCSSSPEFQKSECTQPNLSRFEWNDFHRNTNCTRDSEGHYKIWRKTYAKYLEQLYSIFSRGINPSKVSFSEFSEFAYSNSSGYISRFA
jgi:hypothetical protein